MGGFGSGRPGGYGRARVEACWSLDVNRLQRAGCLRNGWAGSWQWTRDGESVGSIHLRAEPDRLHLSFSYRAGSFSYRAGVDVCDWQDVREAVGIVHVACRFGGSRPYFVCPGVVNAISCGRRQAVRTGPLFPVPPLLPARARQPERECGEPGDPARQQG